MKLIEVLPIGKENKKTRNVLMKESKIKDVEEFKKQLADIKKQYIVIFDDGYYLPASKDEYDNFINKTNEQIKYYTKLKQMANKEMEEKNICTRHI